MNCRLPKKIGTQGGGTTPSEYAVTLVDETGQLSSWIAQGWITLSIGNVSVTGAGTYTAASGSSFTIDSDPSSTTEKVIVNGTVVKSSTSRYTYSHTITSTTRIVYTQPGDMQYSWNITTE